MQKEIIIHNNRKVTKTTKNNGTISYTQRGVYLGIDTLKKDKTKIDLLNDITLENENNK